MNEVANVLAERAAAQAAQYSPLNTALLLVAISVLGMILRNQLANRKLRLAEEQSDREGWGQLIKALQGQVEKMESALANANARIATLEQEKDTDHRLILELLGQLNRTQAAGIDTSNNMSPALRRMIEKTEAAE